MSLIPLQGQSILVDTPDSTGNAGSDRTSQDQPGTALVSWIMTRVNMWEDVRERGYGRLWANYWRLWRGKWDNLDQNRESERSRVITPALAQAIEASVAEVEEAVFAKDVWFDVDERKTPAAEKMTALIQRDQLLQDMDEVNVRGAISESVLNAAIFGTGVVQVNIEVAKRGKPKRDAATHKLKQDTDEHVRVFAESIRPDEFIPDPAGKSISDMLGCAVKRVKPVHAVLEKIQAGIYLKSALPYMQPQPRLMNRDVDKEIDPQSMTTTVESDDTTVVEWHGKVPLGMLNEAMGKKTAADAMLSTPLDGVGSDDPDEQFVEAIVTIANDHVLLRAMSNPFTMKDRSIIAYQYETVPGRFWGRGVAEKGYNPQIALDAAVRAYIDALAFISAPMLGIDSGRLVKGFKNTVYPGKVWLTAGPPADVLSTVQIGRFEPAMFQQSSEMERMVQMGTGAFDTATALNAQSQSGANSMSANSMLMGAFVKRAKRVVQNVDRHLLTPLVTKFMWRYMQFDGVRYQTDFDFNIKATMGIVAREAEAMQLTQLIGMLPDEYHQVKLILAKGIVENTAVTNKAEIMQMVAKVLQPNPQAQQQQQQAQQLQLQVAHAEAEGKLLANQLTIAQIRETLARAAMEAHKGATSMVEVQQEQQRIQQQWADIQNFADQNRIAHQRLSIDNKKADAALISAHAHVVAAHKPTATASS